MDDKQYQSNRKINDPLYLEGSRLTPIAEFGSARANENTNSR